MARRSIRLVLSSRRHLSRPLLFSPCVSAATLSSCVMAMNIQGHAPHRGYPMEVPLPPISSRDGGFGKHFGGRGGLAFNDSLSPSAASNPMAIRGSYDSYVPPPLPPPTLVPIDGPVDPNIQFKERRRHGDHNSPLGDSLGLSFERRELPFKREREFPDEGYQSIDSLRFVVAGKCLPCV